MEAFMGQIDLVWIRSGFGRIARAIMGSRRIKTHGLPGMRKADEHQIRRLFKNRELVIPD
jgi:hypothetical protein